MNFIVYAIFNALVVIMIAPLYISLIKKVKALVQQRKGPNLLQTYYNLFKLFRKESVFSRNSSFVMRSSPYIILVCTILASLSIPLMFIPNDYLGFGSIILFLYLLAMAKFFMALGGLDAGSAFGGMGSSREMSISSIIEPIIIILFAALAFVFRSANLFDIFKETSTGLIPVSMWLLLIPMVIVLLTETARVPIDNPETHLELTMVHEAMILEQSGKELALLELSSAIKQVLFIGLIINIFIPFGFNMGVTIAGLIIAFMAFLLKSSILAAGIGLIESVMPKLRFFRLPNLFALSFFLSLITLIMEVLL